MDALERLVAVQAIRDLVVTYAMAFDDRDWDRLGALWTEDAAWVGPDHAFEGRDALMAFMSTCLPDDYEGKHMNPQTLIEFAEDGQSAVVDTDVVWIRRTSRTRSSRATTTTSSSRATAGCSGAGRRSRSPSRPARRRCRTRRWRSAPAR